MKGNKKVKRNKVIKNIFNIVKGTTPNKQYLPDLKVDTSFFWDISSFQFKANMKQNNFHRENIYFYSIKLEKQNE